MGNFEPAETLWIERLGSLRNVIRQDLIGRQLADHVHGRVSVLDVGCGQGTQALRLAQRGCVVTGVDPSADLLDRFATAATETGVAVELLQGRLEDLDALLGARRFDLVCAHGVLMYVEDPNIAIAQLAQRTARPGGLLSITVRNQHALAMRPGVRGEWADAIAAFDSHDYVNELGVHARAHRLETITATLAAAGMDVVDWWGVRVFNDAVPATFAPPSGTELQLLLDAEDLAGRLDPYRWMASQLHLLATPSPSDATTG